MRPVFRKLLHDLRKVDHGEEIPPGEISEHVDLLFMLQAVWQRGYSCDGLSRWSPIVVDFRTLKIF